MKTPEEQKERARRSVTCAAQAWRKSQTTGSRLALTDAIDALNVLESKGKEEVATSDSAKTLLFAANRYVALDAKEFVLLARLRAIQTDLSSVKSELNTVRNCLCKAVSNEKENQAFRVASNPKLVIAVQWFSNHMTTVRVVDLT